MPNGEILLFAGMMMTILLVVVIVVLAIALIDYIFTGLALMAIGKSRGLKHPWLIWVPFASNYQFGVVADDINGRLGRRSNYRVLLLTFGIIGETIALIASFFSFYLQLEVYSYSYYDESFWMMVYIGTILLSVVSIGVSITYLVFYIKAMYVIFKDYSSSNAVAFTVLSVIFSFLRGPLLFSVRNKPSFSIAKQQYEANYQATYGYRSPDWQNRT